MARTAAVRGAVWGLAAQAAQLVLTFAGLVVLARFLDKDQFGRAAMVLVANGLLSAGADLGLGVPAVRQPRVDQRRIAWLAAAAGAATCLLAVALAPVFARALGGGAGLVALFRVGAIALLLAGLTASARARLVRAFRFGAVAAIDVASAFTAAGAGAVLAWRGLGAWAVVLADVAGATVAAGACWLAAPRAEAGEPPIVRDGVRVAGARAADAALHHVDRLLVGGLLGAGALGLYRFGLQHTLGLVMRLTQVAEQVALPLFARLQHDRAALARAYCALTRVFALAVVPAAAVGWLLAPWLVDLLYPERWREAVPVIRALCFAAAATGLNSHPGVVWLALGRTRLKLYWSASNLLALLLVVAAGARFGLVGVAWALALRAALATVAAQVLTRRVAGVAHADYARALAPGTALGAALFTLSAVLSAG